MALDDRRDPPGRERFDDAVESAARRAARTTALRAATGYFLLVLFLLAGSTLFQRATNRRLDQAERFACQRVQLQRERSNVSDARQFLVFYAVSHNPRVTATIRRTYHDLGATTYYDPPTDCPTAVARPRTYRRPASIPFDRLGSRYAQRLVDAARQGHPQPQP